MVGGPGDARRSRMLWRVLVPVTFLAAGALFGTSRETAQGTDLRGGRFSQLTDLITATQQTVAREERTAADLRKEVAATSADAAASSSTVAAETRRGDLLLGAAGLTPVSGPGLVVSLNDAPRSASGQEPNTSPDNLVVHQQDVQSVLNALWAGGADAVTLMGERVISTSAVRCVGNTLLVQGRLVGPPFVLQAVGDPRRMRAALDAEPGVALFRQYVDAFGLGYVVTDARELRLPAYDGTLDLPHVSGS